MDQDQQSIKVSVVIPIYNVSNYIERCLDSVCAQSYQPIECILVDDCSTDDSMEKCNRFIEKHRSVFSPVVLHHAYNRGLSAARNTGTDAATGEYILYVDSDDELFTNAIALLASAANTVSGMADIVCGTTCEVPPRPDKDVCHFPETELLTSNQEVRRYAYTAHEVLPVTAWNKLVRRKFLIENRISFREGLLYEDNLWSFACAQYAQCVAFVRQPTYMHYATPGSIMSQSNLQQESKHFSLILDEITLQMGEPFLDAQLSKYFIFFLNYYSNTPSYRLIAKRFTVCSVRKGHCLMALLTKFFVWSYGYEIHRLFRHWLHGLTRTINRKAVSQR